MTKTIGFAALALALAAPMAVQAQDTGTWLVRARAVRLDSANDNSGQLKATLATLGSKEASINDKTIPEVDITYFFSPNFAAELILTYPQKQKLSATNVGELGTFKHLPPTLTAQYHFTGLPVVRPYVGLGVNYTNISDTKWSATGKSLGLSLDHNSVGLAAQVGADFPLGGGWMFNVDLKKVQIGTDVKSNGSKIGEFKVDPWLFGLGVGYRF